MSQASSTPQADWGPPVIATPPPPPPSGWPQSPQPVQSGSRIVYVLWAVEDKMVPFQGFIGPLASQDDMWNKPIGTPVPQTFRSKLGEYPTREAALLARPLNPDLRFDVTEEFETPLLPCPQCHKPSPSGAIHPECRPAFFAQGADTVQTEFAKEIKWAEEISRRQGPPNPLAVKAAQPNS